jgi:hypothetical protein
LTGARRLEHPLGGRAPGCRPANDDVGSSPRPTAPTTLAELNEKGGPMASSGKKKTTMAKLMRETKLRERRLDKQAKKEARKLAPADAFDEAGGMLVPDPDESAQPPAESPELEGVGNAQSDD